MKPRKRKPSHDPEDQLRAARIILANPEKVDGSALLLDWAKKVIERHEATRGQGSLLGH